MPQKQICPILASGGVTNVEMTGLQILYRNCPKNKD